MTEEDDEMMRSATAVHEDPRRRDELGASSETSTLPTETLARLDRLASASLLGAGLAHEIANPLGTLLAALDEVESRVRELRRQGAGDLDDLAADLELATTSASAITDLVHDFQVFLRPESKETPLVSIKDAVARALRIARPRLMAISRLDIQLRDVPAVRAPASRVVQVVLNLLLNAIEALAIRAREENLISVRLDVSADHVLVEISDNGPGLPLTIRDRVFEPGISQKSGRQSSGLGLAISRELITRMGGEITVASLPAAGTTFIISLPIG